jgi:glycyl-tRNA synthetase beta chain
LPPISSAPASLAEAAGQAARLAKADLTTQMVFEFPELQGVMGGIYAREQGLPEAVWKAIYHHYLPIGVEPDAPPAPAHLGQAAGTWAAVSLADKVDSLVVLLRGGEKATGSRDPFGLRRQAQGIVRVLMDLPELAGIDREIALGRLFELALADRLQGAPAGTHDILRECLSFSLDRVRYALERRGIAAGVVRAVTAGEDVSPLRARRVAEALQGMRASEDFQALAVLFKRVKNITKDIASGAAVERGALVEPAEQALLADVDARRPRVAQASARHDYRGAFAEIAGLRAAVDRFFTEVFVMAEDERLRQARLALVADLRNLVLDLADISEIAPQTE